MGRFDVYRSGVGVGPGASFVGFVWAADWIAAESEAARVFGAGVFVGRNPL
jgi:hypothetical protein